MSEWDASAAGRQAPHRSIGHSQVVCSVCARIILECACQGVKKSVTSVVCTTCAASLRRHRRPGLTRPGLTHPGPPPPAGSAAADAAALELQPQRQEYERRLHRRRRRARRCTDRPAPLW